jgi:hypothetical protein
MHWICANTSTGCSFRLADGLVVTTRGKKRIGGYECSLSQPYQYPGVYTKKVQLGGYELMICLWICLRFSVDKSCHVLPDLLLSSRPLATWFDINVHGGRAETGTDLLLSYSSDQWILYWQLRHCTYERGMQRMEILSEFEHGKQIFVS